MYGTSTWITGALNLLVRTAVSQYPLLFGEWFTRLDKVYTRELYSVAVPGVQLRQV